MRYLLLLLLFLKPVFASGPLTGRIIDEQTKEPITGANVWLLSSGKGMTTPENGCFSLTLHQKSDTLCISHIAYKKLRIAVNKNSAAATMLIRLTPSILDMPAVRIEAIRDRADDSMVKMETGARIIDAGEIRNTTFTGEPDLYRFITTLPGVTCKNPLAAEPHVRGGSSDHDLVLIDDIPLTQSHHLLGIFSAINSSMVDRVAFSPGGMSCRYGNRLGALTKVHTKFKYNNTGGDAAVSLISSRFFYEKDFGKLHWSLAARRTYLDVFLKAFGKKLPYYFYDINNRWGRPINDKTVLEGGFTLFTDVMYNDNTSYCPYFVENEREPVFAYQTTKDYRFPWSSVGAWVRLEHFYQPNLLFTTTFVYSKSNNRNKDETSIEFGGGDRLAYDAIKDSLLKYINDQTLVKNSFSNNTLKMNVLYDVSEKTSWLLGSQVSLYGFHYTWQNFGTDIDKDQQLYFDYSEQTPNLHFVQNRVYGAFFAEATFAPTPLLTLRPGVRLEKLEGFQPTLSPRFNMRYEKYSPLLVTFSAGRFYQNIATARERGMIGFLDLHFPTRPESADQAVLGFQLGSGVNTLSLNLYGRKFNNLLASTGGGPKLVNINGRAAGLECSAKAAWKHMFFQFAYTWAQTRRTLEGKVLFPAYDVRHTLYTNLTIPMKNNWHFTTSWQFSSGAPYDADGHPTWYRQFVLDRETGEPYYTGYFQESVATTSGDVRYPAQHRLDIGFVKELGPKRWSTAPFIQIYNVYNHHNVLKYNYLEKDLVHGTNPGKIKNDNLTYYFKYDWIPFLPTIGIRVRL